ncbi:hypothetical protein CYMTET_10935 [Cymbomonas tetramitiformis]|uniref:Protein DETOXIFICATION n=1 Tax=Cymbomonas tetramitiformis TaxID=36881 RepID=A0AAE0LDB7_9CHLO|nr:hypothetical protein CYMTET_10935 [Cymbomonas tetramitiformis]
MPLSCRFKTCAAASEADGVSQSEADGSSFDTLYEVKRILKFGLPALSVPLSDPLMTTIDTIFVGQGCSTVELASLGPNATVFAVLSYAFGFLATGTTKRLASADKDEVAGLMQRAIFLACVMGSIMLMLSEGLSTQLLLLAGTNQDVMPAALSYFRVRALAQPAVILIAVMQGGLLAVKDSITPLKSTAVGCVVNILGDYLMVSHLGLGTAGVAWATVFSQFSALMVLTVSWARHPQSPFKSMRLPSLSELKTFTDAFGTLWGISALRTLCYSCIRTAAAALGTLPCAAHTAIYSVWMPASFMPIPLRQSAMVFLNEHMIHRPPQPDGLPASTRLTPYGAKLLYVLLVLGVICGGLSGMLVAGVGHFTPWVLTQDPSLYPIIASTVVPGFIALSISGAMEVAEGVMLISSKDDNNRLLRAMALTIILLNMLLFYNQKAEFGILGVWWALVSFYVLRTIQPLFHIWNTMLSRSDNSTDFKTSLGTNS